MARRPTLDFLKTESGAGLVLAFAALAAVVAANSPAAADYFGFIDTRLPIQFGAFAETRSIAGWVKDEQQRPPLAGFETVSEVLSSLERSLGA